MMIDEGLLLLLIGHVHFSCHGQGQTVRDCLLDAVLCPRNIEPSQSRSHAIITRIDTIFAHKACMAAEKRLTATCQRYQRARIHVA